MFPNLLLSECYPSLLRLSNRLWVASFAIWRAALEGVDTHWARMGGSQSTLHVVANNEPLPLSSSYHQVHVTIRRPPGLVSSQITYYPPRSLEETAEALPPPTISMQLAAWPRSCDLRVCALARVHGRTRRMLPAWPETKECACALCCLRPVGMCPLTPLPRAKCSAHGLRTCVRRRHARHQ